MVRRHVMRALVQELEKESSQRVVVGLDVEIRVRVGIKTFSNHIGKVAY